MAILTSAVTWIIGDTIAKRSSVVIGNRQTAAIFLAIGAIPMLIGALLYGYQMSLEAWGLAALAGVFLGIGYYSFYKALETEQLTNSAALFNLQPAIIVLFGLLVLGNAVSTVKDIAIAGIFVGSLMITVTRKMKFNMMLMPAVTANVAWGINWVLTIIAIGVSQQFLMPLLVARVVGLTSVLVMSSEYLTRHAAHRHSFRKPETRRIRWLAAPSGGALDGIGNITFAFAMFTGVVALGSALSAIIPAFIAVVAYFVFKDRLTKLQGAGLIISVIAAIAISLG
ncbi:MAG: DMT family transporter [Candidatus Micrarchaeota archaeon]|nr:DMT family transporter [Candidatus Micrarchaeota archaeon]